MQSDVSKAFENVIATIDNESNELAIDEYKKLLERLKSLIHDRLNSPTFIKSVEQKLNDLR